MANAAKLKDILNTLDAGGRLRFEWGYGGGVTLIDASGSASSVDGRSYHAFVCDGHNKAYICSETGDTTKGDLVMEWHRPEPAPVGKP